MNDTCNENQNGSLKIQECLTLILEIGIACSKEFPRKKNEHQCCCSQVAFNSAKPS